MFLRCPVPCPLLPLADPQVQRGASDWLVIQDVGTAVDNVLDGRRFAACRRTRDSSTGMVRFSLVHL